MAAHLKWWTRKTTTTEQSQKESGDRQRPSLFSSQSTLGKRENVNFSHFFSSFNPLAEGKPSTTTT